MRSAVSLLAAAVFAVLAWPAAADPLADQVKADMPELMIFYRDLHSHPELSMQETRSAGLLAAEARKLGFEVTTGVGKTGVVAVMRNGPGPVLLIRADMDALPVIEQTGLPFASTVRGTSLAGVESGVMHACGHDTHMTTWVETARRMAAMRKSWSGTLVMIGQPGEETGAGAKAMLDDGLYTRFPKPAYALAFHDSASLPAGVIGYKAGWTLANVDSVDLLVKGIGGHGAYPQATKDPIVLASRIVMALQTLVSRENDPQSPAVVTVGSFHAGAKHNIISDEAKLQLTVRSYTDETRKLLLDGIARIARGEAIAAGMPDDKMPEITLNFGGAVYTPATFNTEKLTANTAALLTRRFGAARVQTGPASMAGEDFSRYHRADEAIESMIFWVGGVPKAKWDAVGGDPAKLPSLHSPYWAPDAEAVIQTASEAMVTAAIGVLGRKG
ncbi:MAG: amidohydrolase [Alphaproteobacteria bacterium]|nr:amidohydrolase [Alphaproteobacteria bacterium]